MKEKRGKEGLIENILKKKRYSSVFYSLIIFIFLIFLSEAGIMIILGHSAGHAFTDGLTLTAIILPLAYFFLFRPAIKHIKEIEKTEKKLAKRNEELERFHKVVIGREERIIELKDKLNELEKQLEGKKRK